MHFDWLDTTTRVLRDLPNLRGHLRPTFHLPDVRMIDRAFLARHEVRGVVWDVDGTLMSYHAHAIAPEFLEHMQTLFRDDGARHAAVSNCDETRFDELTRILPEVALIRVYDTPDGPVTRCVRRGVDSLAPAGPPAAPAIRKPSAALIHAAAEVLGDIATEQLLVVGDQYCTDIASANLAQARSVKVATYRRETFPLILQVAQRLEALLAGGHSSAPGAPPE